MQNRRVSLRVISLLGTILFPLAALADNCTDLNGRVFGDATVRSATVQSGTFTVPGFIVYESLPKFCRVIATASPVKESNILVEIWLPTETWNGKLLGTGNGGFGGWIIYSALAAGLKRSYATVNTDMGTQTTVGGVLCAGSGRIAGEGTICTSRVCTARTSIEAASFSAGKSACEIEAPTGS